MVHQQVGTARAESICADLCNQSGGRKLAGPLLDHLAKDYLQDEPLLNTLKSSFSSLPDAYALSLLKAADVELRQQMSSTSRVPLALAEQARSMLQHARLIRAREALFCAAVTMQTASIWRLPCCAAKG